MIKRQEIYDLYWYFACERQNIFIKKLNGEPSPWTTDEILQNYKFCNSYRVNDRVSQYLLKNVIYNGKKYSDADMIFRIICGKKAPHAGPLLPRQPHGSSPRPPDHRVRQPLPRGLRRRPHRRRRTGGKPAPLCALRLLGR